MKKEITDFDLDIINELKEFPDTENDGYIYIRAQIKSKGGNNVEFDKFSVSKGTMKVLTTGIVGLMESDSADRMLILNSVLNYFLNNPHEIATFERLFENVKKQTTKVRYENK